MLLKSGCATPWWWRCCCRNM